MPSLEVHHVAIVVADLSRAEAFYQGLLGLPLIRRHHTAEGVHRATWLGLGARTFLALELATAPAPTRSDEAPGLHCLALRIGRAERVELAAHLTAAGHAIVRETAYTFYVRDPDGVLVGLSHHPEERAVEP